MNKGDRKKLKFQPILILVILLVVFFLSFLVVKIRQLSLWPSLTPKVDMLSKSKTALENGINWLLGTEEKFSGGATFIIKELNEICNDNSLEQLWKEKIEEDLKMYPFVYRALGIKYDFNPKDCPNYATSYTITDLSRLYTSFVLCEVIYCDSFDTKKIIEDINSIEDDNGYYSNHKLLSLLLMKEFNCHNAVLDELIKEKSEELINIQDSSQEFKEPIDPIELDIYLERVALIGYAGYEIKDNWIENVIDTQKQDGSWTNNPHTTALALWALAQKSKTCK